jgi:hypothetical protein
MLGGVWGLNTYVIGGVRDDVGAIRQSVQGLQGADKDGLLRLRDAETRLGDQISGLRTDLASFRGEISGFRSEMSAYGKLVGTLSDLQKQIEVRQASFDDPKAAASFVAALKGVGIDEGKIVIIPWGGAAFSPK